MSDTPTEISSQAPTDEKIVEVMALAAYEASHSAEFLKFNPIVAPRSIEASRHRYTAISLLRSLRKSGSCIVQLGDAATNEKIVGLVAAATEWRAARIEAIENTAAATFARLAAAEGALLDALQDLRKA